MSSVRHSSGTRLFWLILLSAVFPPAAVVIEFGFGWDLFVNILLTILIPLAGFIHSVYLLCNARYTNLRREEFEPVPDEAPSCSSRATSAQGQAQPQIQRPQSSSNPELLPTQHLLSPTNGSRNAKSAGTSTGPLTSSDPSSSDPSPPPYTLPAVTSEHLDSKAHRSS